MIILLKDNELKKTKIAILYTELYKIRMSDVDAPSNDYYVAETLLISGDKKVDIMLIHGYLWNINVSNGIKNEPPRDIINIIGIYYSYEMLHLFRFNRSYGHKHFTLPVDRVLSC